MYLQAFHKIVDGHVNISPEQASHFAKDVAGDFNPLHNPGAKRFCVPGDLLFALVLARNGLSQQMYYKYTGMVGQGVFLDIPTDTDGEFAIIDGNGKSYLEVRHEGNCTKDLTLIEKFTRAYVAFSGHSFPDILVPLMKEQDVMLNPDRPMVIYESMSFKLDRLDLSSPILEFDHSTLDVKGKRGDVRLTFNVLENGEIVGKGCKSLVAGGLRAFDQEKVDDMVELYEGIRDNYK